MAQAEVVAKGLLFPEGPVVLPDGRVALCEQKGSRLSVLTDAGVEELVQTGGSPNGATLGSDGMIYVAQNGGFVGDWRSPSPKTPGVQKVGLDGTLEEVGQTLGAPAIEMPNDICFGPNGRLYFTDPAHGFDLDARQAGRIYVAEMDGAVSVLVEPGPVYPNGIGFLADGRLIWAESYDCRLMVLGAEGSPELFCQLPETHIPDGFARAADGRLFAATVSSHGISVVSPDGEYQDLIELDDHAIPTNCAFTGSTLWVTDAGADWATKDDDGRLWKVETDAVGADLHAGSIG